MTARRAVKDRRGVVGSTPAAVDPSTHSPQTPDGPPAGPVPARYVARCTKCGRAWGSLVECHCARCCFHGSGVEAFDRHRVGHVDNPRCLDPATARRPDGERVFEEHPTAFGPAWRVRRDRTDDPWYGGGEA
jgi:hypothetical protein